MLICLKQYASDASRPARGGWIEIFTTLSDNQAIVRSRPARGGWIEIRAEPRAPVLGAESRPARGGWIEIHRCKRLLHRTSRPAPHGAGGLKSFYRGNPPPVLVSRPARGGWIEIVLTDQLGIDITSPAPHGAGGLKYPCLGQANRQPGVPPRMGRVD